MGGFKHQLVADSTTSLFWCCPFFNWKYLPILFRKMRLRMSTVKNARRLHQYLAIPPVHLQVMIYLYWLVVEPTPLKNMSQLG